MQANTARLRYIPDLLTVHLEELEFLWGQRRLALYSPRYFLRDFLHLNELSVFALRLSLLIN